MLKPKQDAALSATPATPAPSATGRRVYSTPRLTEFGDITKLTQNGSGSGADGGTMGGMFMMCL